MRPATLRRKMSGNHPSSPCPIGIAWAAGERCTNPADNTLHGNLPPEKRVGQPRSVQGKEAAGLVETAPRLRGHRSVSRSSSARVHGQPERRSSARIDLASQGMGFHCPPALRTVEPSHTRGRHGGKKSRSATWPGAGGGHTGLPR